MAEPMTAGRRAELRRMAADARAAGKPHDWPWCFAVGMTELLDALEFAEAETDTLRAAANAEATFADEFGVEANHWHEETQRLEAERDVCRDLLRRTAAVMAESVVGMDDAAAVGWHGRQEAVLAEIKGLLGDKPDG